MTRCIFLTHYALILVCLLFSTPAFAQLRPVSGKVIDAETGEALECVHVFVAPERGAVTNGSGNFTVMANPNENIRFTFVGYKTQYAKASGISGAIKLQPMTSSLAEFTVLTDKAIIEKVEEKLRKDYNKHQSTFRKYFNRITYQNMSNTEMIESFIEAQSAVHLRHQKLSSGKHYALNRLGESAHSSFESTNLHELLGLGPMIRRDFWKEILTIPFPDDFNIKKMEKIYDVKRADLTDEDNPTDGIIHFQFTSKGGKREKSVMEGDMYVDAENYQLQRFNGTVKNIVFTRGFNTKKGETTEENLINIEFNINYSHAHGFTEVSSMSFHVFDGDISFKSVLTDVTDMNLPLVFPIEMGANLLATIREAGYTPEVFEKYTIIERTEEEEQLATAADNGPEETATAQDTGTELARELASTDQRPNSALLSHIQHAMHFNDTYPQEKVYLHLDNTAYFKGETIWFKAYVQRTDEEAASDISKILYVELLNPQGDVVAKRKLAISNGISKGEIKVDDIMVTGFYELRAFTRHMTNWGPEACFSRVIPIFKEPKEKGDWSDPSIDMLGHNKRLNNERQTSDEEANTNVIGLTGEEQSTETVSQKSRGINVSFYPEGGNIVQGLHNRVALLATDKNGAVSALACRLVDEEGNTLSSASTDAFGRVALDIAPGMERAKIVATDADGQERSFRLPKSSMSGCALHVNATNADKVGVEIESTSDLTGKSIAYVVMHGGKIVRCDTLTARSAMSLSFNRRLLPKGVNQFTLFDENGRILAERLFFVHPAVTATSNINVKATSQTIKPCGKVTFTLNSQPYSNISFSAVDAEGLVNGPHGNINTYMLLDSEIRSYISRPEYYVEKDDEEHRLATDLLMMVQGWRKYDWKLMSGQSTFEKTQPAEDRLYLSGKVITKDKKYKDKPLAVGVVFSRMGAEPFGAATDIDSIGRYAFALPNIVEDWDLRLITRDESGEAVKSIITIDRNFSPKGRFISEEEAQVIPTDSLRFQAWNVNEADSAVWESITKKNFVLQDVTVKAKKRKSRTRWSNEHSAALASNIRYDCDEASEQYADEGLESPLFTEWLKEKNSLFSGQSQASEVAIGVDSTKSDIVTFMPYYEYDPNHEKPPYDIDPPSHWIRTFMDGLAYKGRPIMWIADNQFCTITNFSQVGSQKRTVFTNDNSSNTNIDLPIFLDEVKTVFISEELEPLKKHLNYDGMDSQHYIGVYLYTHRSNGPREKGARYTSFQGFNLPSTFKTEDYNVIPPMEDFRRTIYWNPNVITDANGNARIEFWNNSSCTEMYISAEGMTKDGKIVWY